MIFINPVTLGHEHTILSLEYIGRKVAVIGHVMTQPRFGKNR